MYLYFCLKARIFGKKTLHSIKVEIFSERKILKYFIKKILIVTLKYLYIFRKQKSLKNSFTYWEKTPVTSYLWSVLIFHSL